MPNASPPPAGTPDVLAPLIPQMEAELRELETSGRDDEVVQRYEQKWLIQAAYERDALCALLLHHEHLAPDGTPLKVYLYTSELLDEARAAIRAVREGGA